LLLVGSIAMLVSFRQSDVSLSNDGRNPYKREYYKNNRAKIAAARKEKRKNHLQVTTETRAYLLTLQIKTPSFSVSSRILPLILPNVSKREIVEKKMQDLFSALESVDSKTFYRKKFRMKWSFSLGHSAFTHGCNGFEEQHNIQEKPFTGQGINRTDPLHKEVPGWQKDIYCFVKELFSLVAPKMVKKQFMVHVGKMCESSNNVPIHVDGKDIGPQVVLHLGSWSGASLRCFSTKNKKKPSKDFVDLTEAGKFFWMDGRLAHRVVKCNFSGVRYSLIVFRLWNEDITSPEPIFYPPQEIKV
jgi:hypothetical protein